MVPRSQNVRYQCANVGFLPLKLPSHSGIIHAHCLSPSNYTIRHQFLAATFLRVPYRRHPLTLAASASPYRIGPPRHPRSTPPSSVVPLGAVPSFVVPPCRARAVINYDDDDDGDDVLSSRTSAGK